MMGQTDFLSFVSLILVFLAFSNSARGDLSIETDPLVSPAVSNSDDNLKNNVPLENPLTLSLSETKEHKGEENQAPSQIMRSSTPKNLTVDQSLAASGGGEEQKKKEEIIHFIMTNVGSEDEVLSVNVRDEKGFVNQSVSSNQIYLSSGSSTELSVQMIYPPKNSNETVSNSPDIITIDARGKGNTVKRSAYYYYPGSDYEYSQQYQPFCYDRYVTGNCRYRTDPYNCDQYKWTAYATIQSSGGIQQLRSIPEGLYIPPEFQPGTRDRIRVYLTVSCCIPIVQFISVNPYHPNVGNACIVDVRELQWLHPGEIAGIVIGSIALVVIIVVFISLAIKRRRDNTILVGHTATTSTHTRAHEST